MRWLRDKGKRPQTFEICAYMYNILWERSREGGRMQTVVDSGLYIDSGFLSDLEAMSGLRELLDELYELLD